MILLVIMIPILMIICCDVHARSSPLAGKFMPVPFLESYQLFVVVL